MLGCKNEGPEDAFNLKNYRDSESITEEKKKHYSQNDDF